MWAPYPGPSLADRAGGLIRLVHPFPSVLDGLATGALAIIAGAAFPDAVRLALSMTALQAGIGAVNDLVDAPADAVGKGAKPIPAGLVAPRAAAAIAVGSILLGLVLAVPSGPVAVAIAAAGLAVGLSYDVWLKGTPWSWLPFAIGIPLLPVYAWYGGTGTLPEEFAILIPAGIAAGAALAIGNARADLERDLASGVESVATALGARRTWWLQVLILAGVGVVAIASAAARGATFLELTVLSLAATFPLIAALLSLDVGPDMRERAWEAEAVGVAVLGVAWLWIAVA